MKEIIYKDIEILEIFDEIETPIFFSFKLNNRGSKKNVIYISIFADYDLDTDTDIYLTTSIFKKEYDKLISGDIEIRSCFVNSPDLFLIYGFFNDFKLLPVQNNKIEEYYPDSNVFLNFHNGEYYFIDKNELLNEVEDLKPLKVIETSGIKKFLENPIKNKDYWFVSFGNNYKNLTADVLGDLLNAITRIKNDISKNSFELFARHSFEGSYGISFEINEEICINEDTIFNDMNEINSLFTIINDSKYKENPQLIAKTFGNKVTKPLQDFLTILISNNLDFKSLYIDKDNRVSAGYINTNTLESFEFLIENEIIVEERLLLNDGFVTKIDVKNKSFGIEHENMYFKGQISDKLIDKYKNEWIDFRIGNVKKINLIKKLITHGISSEQKTVYVLEDLTY
ncbi:hypothetical protein [Macrococcus sp. DPC7161]|uniref:hypothetical protein n=1 Tax=Macrococcus sp. DPC7161 TaxID=2507060 RepID=UPI00100B5705|nr:hypothetical protein [Macrococcus sp. DPC7161]RXK18930.1 hypothetical protein ER639_01070 [Macrococcus sp. DPC7161]